MGRRSSFRARNCTSDSVTNPIGLGRSLALPRNFAVKTNFHGFVIQREYYALALSDALGEHSSRRLNDVKEPN